MYGAPPGAPYGAPPGYGAPHALNPMGQYYFNMVDASRIAMLRSQFNAVDKDKSGSITATELTSLQFEGKRFSLDTTKQLVKVFDVDKSGHISFDEYAALHQFVISMQVAFYACDRDGSGKLDTPEVLSALIQGGFNLNLQTIQLLMNKFIPPSPTTTSKYSSSVNQPRALDFEHFLQLSAYLGQIRSTFMVLDTQRVGAVTLNMDQLVQLCVNL